MTGLIWIGAWVLLAVAGWAVWRRADWWPQTPLVLKILTTVCAPIILLGALFMIYKLANPGKHVEAAETGIPRIPKFETVAKDIVKRMNVEIDETREEYEDDAKMVDECDSIECIDGVLDDARERRRDRKR